MYFCWSCTFISMFFTANFSWATCFAEKLFHTNHVICYHVGGYGEVNDKHLYKWTKEWLVYFIDITLRCPVPCEMLLGRRIRLESESSASLAAARHSFPLTYRLGRGNLDVSRVVCITMELELSLRFPSHGTSTRSHVPAVELEFFQVPFSWNLNIVQYNMYRRRNIHNIQQ